ncbi:hypothetical protein [Sphingomonas sp. Ant20]|uniref:hypothetical protein n=1 Tax=Sphingomonas sp. Ant20 TaxID=104605 RepID=UPI000B2CAC3E|nr:hypothetical protein [Sphingomonas sp. Ant20]
MPDDDIDDAARVDRADLDAIVADALVVVDQVQSLEPYLPQLAPHDRERVDDYVRRASADATLRAYKSDWRLFCAWCQESGYRPLPATPATVAAFLTLLAESGFSPQELRRTKRGVVLPRKEPVPLGRATIGRRLAAIVFAHRAADVEPPTSQPDAARLERAMRGIRKDKRGEMPGKKRPATAMCCATWCVPSLGRICGATATARYWQSAWPAHSGVPNSWRSRSGASARTVADCLCG